MTEVPPIVSTSGPRRMIVWFLAIGYGAILLTIAFWPSPIDRPVAGLLDRVIRELHERGVPAFIDYTFIEFSANVALFIPVGLLFSLALPRSWWPVMLLCGPALSALIELAQRELLAERYATLADVVSNSIGATVGVVLGLALRAVVAYRDRRVIANHESTR